jgi:hypothetical protein
MRNNSGLIWAGLIICVLAAGTLAFPQKTSTSDLMTAADEMVKGVIQLRALQPKTPIQKGVKSREEIFKYLNEHVRKTYSEEELREEGETLRELGLIPADMDYKGFVLKLLTEQVEGFYDPDDKTFYIASWIPAEAQKPTMVHELTHALQDQYFDLNRILNDEEKVNNNDQALAHQAVIEGDAVAVMLNYLLAPAKRDFASLPNLAFVMRSMSSSTQGNLAIYKSAPLYLQEELVFPYGYGAAFLQKVWDKNPSWDAVNKIFYDLPLSTEQIMHPAKYLETRDNPKPVEIQNPANLLGDKWKVIYTNVLGEFTLNIFLRLQLSEEQANRAAEGWGGDQLMLLETSEGKRGVLISTIWDSPEDADEFYQALTDWFAKKHPAEAKIAEPSNQLAYRHNGEMDAAVRNGTQIRLIISFPEDAALKLIQ